jgi:hypothetical protein
MEVNSGGRLNVEVNFGGDIQCNMEVNSGAVLYMEAIFGGYSFIRRILKGCRGRFSKNIEAI